MRGCDIINSNYNIVTSNTPYAATVNVRMLIRHQYSNTYNINIRS